MFGVMVVCYAVFVVCEAPTYRVHVHVYIVDTALHGLRLECLLPPNAKLPDASAFCDRVSWVTFLSP